MRKFLIFLSAFLILLLGLWGTVVLMLDEDRLKTLAIEQVEQRTGRNLTLDGPLEVRLFPRIELVAEDVTLDGPPELDGPPLFTADALRMSVALWPLIQSEIETGALTLEGAEIQLYTDRSGRTTLDGLQQAAAPADGSTERPTDGSGQRPEVSVEAIRLNDVRLIVTDERTNSVQQFLMERFELDAFRFDTPVPFVFRGRIGDPATLEEIELGGTILVPAGDGPIRIDGIELSARSGELTMGMTGDLLVETGTVVSARFDDGRVRLADQQLDVSATWRGTARPSVTAEVRGDALDVDALLAMLASGTDESADPDQPSPLLALRDIDVDADLELGRMQIGGLPLRDVQAELTVRNGIATLDPLEAGLQGGAVAATGRLDLNAEPARVEIRPRFDLESLSDALAPWGLDRFLTGAGSLDLALTGRGLTPNALLASLDGQGAYDFRDGTIRGVNLDGMISGLAARDVAGAVRSGVGGSTSFREFTGPLQVDNGVVDLSGLTLLTEQLGVGGSVQLGLADLSLNGQLRLAGERLQRVPLQLGGTLTAPQLTPDVGAVVRDEAERRVMDFLQRRLDGDDEDGEPDSDSDSDADAGGDGPTAPGN